MEEKTMTQPLSNLFKVMFQFPRAPPGSQARKTSPRVDDPALRWLRQLWDFMQKLGYYPNIISLLFCVCIVYNIM